MSDTKSAKKLGGHTPLRTLERGCVRRTSRSTAEREAALNRSNALLPLQRPSVRDGAATGASPTVALRAARAARRAVAQTFLSAGSGDFPVPSAILKTVLASTMNPRSTKTSA